MLTHAEIDAHVNRCLQELAPAGPAGSRAITHVDLCQAWRMAKPVLAALLVAPFVPPTWARVAGILVAALDAFCVVEKLPAD